MIDTRTTVTDAVIQPNVADRYDVIVLGGGPAGATTAAFLAKAGKSVLVLERSAVPRFHVGESLIPDTYWTLQKLGLLDALRASAFPKKYSVQFIAGNGKLSAPFYFDEYNPHESSQTWQVERGVFDQMLLDHAKAHGAVVRSHAQVLDVLFDGEQAVGVSVRLNDGGAGEVRNISASVVVDATGQSTFLASRMGLRRPDPRLRKGTIWTYWKGAQRDPGKDEGATLIISTQNKDSWFWYIPLSDDVVSVGCTGDMDYIFAKHRGTPAEIYQQEVALCPGVQPRIANATRCADYFTTKDFSYLCTRASGPGYVMVGDAAGFIDPIYSSGVYLALKSADMASEAILEGFATNDFSGETLGRWFDDFVRGKEMFHKLVYAFYTKEFSFASFLGKYPQHKNGVTDILIGNVFRDGLDELFEAMHAEYPATRPDYAPALLAAV